MIYGSLSHISSTQMSAFCPAINRAITWLQAQNLSALPLNEKIFIEDKIFLSVVEKETKPLSECRPEVHRRYLDIHVLIEGVERIGIAFDDGQNEILEQHPGERDVIFYNDAKINDSFLALHPGQFVIVFPEDVHRALYMRDIPQTVRKAVVKIDISLL